MHLAAFSPDADATIYELTLAGRQSGVAVSSVCAVGRCTSEIPRGKQIRGESVTRDRPMRPMQVWGCLRISKSSAEEMHALNRVYPRVYGVSTMGDVKVPSIKFHDMLCLSSPLGENKFWISWISLYRNRLKGLYVVARNLFLLLPTCYAWSRLGPA